MLDDICIVIPSLNPDDKLINTVNSLKKEGFKRLVIVDDGSDQNHKEIFSQLGTGTVIIHHKINKGKGAALKTAFKYILSKDIGKAGIITVDGDGQHSSKDVLACAEKIIKEKDKVVLGCRDFSQDNVPKRSRMGNNITKFVFKHLCGMPISDTQTGLRAFPFNTLPILLETQGDRFEYETNIFFKLKQKGIEICEVPIETVYIEENASSHFKPVRDSIRIYRFILSFMASSLISCGVDIALFYILSKILKIWLWVWVTAGATVGARIVSSITNYSINRKKVFYSDKKVSKSIFKYFGLAVVQMGISALLVTIISLITRAEAGVTTLYKAVVDTILFFISYRIQQNWVFAETKQKNKKAREKLTAKKVVARCFLSFATVICLTVITALSTGFVLARGPSETMRNMLVLSAKQASATKWLPEIFLSKKTVKKIVDGSKKIDTDVIEASGYLKDDEADEWADAVDGMKLEFISKPKFKAYLLSVKNPNRVKVGVSSNDFKTATAGMRIFDIVQKYKVSAVINAGEFADVGGVGTGAAPIGLTYSFGNKVWDDGFKRTFIGFDKNNNLICKENMTASQAEELGIRDAVSFQNGNVLIENDQKNIKLHYSNNNTGTAQRTAIAQKSDGTVLLLVTDGRSASSIGATRNDVIDILVEKGAVSAGMLDGGSSTMMYFKNYYDIYDIDKSELDTYQQKGLVNSYKAFTNPRRIPTYFIVTEE